MDEIGIDVVYDGFEEDLEFIYRLLSKINFLSSIETRGYSRRMYEIRKLVKPVIQRLDLILFPYNLRSDFDEAGEEIRNGKE